MKQLTILIGFVFVIFVYRSELQFSSETSWEFFGNDGGCSLEASSHGVGLRILTSPTLYSLTIMRPSKLNDLISRSIKWPEKSDFDNDYREQEIFAVSFSIEPSKMKFKKMVLNGGSGWDISSYDKNDVLNFASMIINNDVVEVFKNFSTFTGYEVTRLGRWRASTNADKDKIENFSLCVDQS